MRVWAAKGNPRITAVEDLDGWRNYWQIREHRSKQAPAPFAVYRPQIGAFRHEISPQEWALDSDQMRTTILLRPTEQLGANVYSTGAGLGYLQFSERPDYQNWYKTVRLPSQRETSGG